MNGEKTIIGITVGTPINPNRFGAKGESAYEIALKNGFVGTEQEWLDSLRPVLNQKQFNSLRPLANKKILCLGDELMGNDQVNGVPSYLAEYSGATVYNGGFARSGFARRTTSSANVCFDLPNIIDAMATGNWSVHETQAESVSNSTPAYSYFPDTVAMMKTIDFSKIDAITLAYGTIDWSDGKNADYVVSELKASIDKLQLNFPEMRILVITPIWRYFTMGSSSSDDYKEYGEGYTLREWAKKIEDAAKEKHISVLNAYENMPLSYNNASTYFDKNSSNADGLHHINLNEKGNQMYAQLICGKLSSMFASQNPDSYEQGDLNLTVDDSLRFNEDGTLGVNTTSIATKNDIPKNISAFENDVGYLKEHQSLEGYAKTSDIPTVPTKVSAFENDKAYLTEETDPTVPTWAKEPNKPIYTASEVGADASGTASILVTAHNTGTEVHSDIRLLIQNLTDRLDAVANSSDKELDQLSEIVAFIKSNKSLIDSITTSKVGVADIINNLTTNVTDKPLSAAQGVVLKALIDAITVPTKVSQLENDKNYLTQHQDLSAYAKKTDIPTVPTKVSQLNNDVNYTTEAQVDTKLNTKQDKLTSYVSSVNGKSGAVSLNASDVGALPSDTVIPTVPTKVSAFENDKGYLTEHQDLSAYAKKTDIPTVPTALSQLSQDSTHQVVTDTEKSTWNAKSNFSGNYNDLTNKPSIPSAYTHPSTHPSSMITGLSTVATSGSYNDLSNKPTIPTVPSSLPANGGNADTVDGYHIRTGTSGAAGYITFVV